MSARTWNAKWGLRTRFHPTEEDYAKMASHEVFRGVAASEASCQCNGPRIELTAIGLIIACVPGAHRHPHFVRTLVALFGHPRDSCPVASRPLRLAIALGHLHQACPSGLGASSAALRCVRLWGEPRTETRSLRGAARDKRHHAGRQRCSGGGGRGQKGAITWPPHRATCITADARRG